MKKNAKFTEFSYNDEKLRNFYLLFIKTVCSFTV